MNLVSQMMLAPAVYYMTNRTVTGILSSRADREDLDHSIMAWAKTARTLINYQQDIKIDEDHPAFTAKKMVLTTVEEIEYLVTQADRSNKDRWSVTKAMWPSDFTQLNRKLDKLKRELDERMKILLKLLKLSNKKKDV